MLRDSANGADTMTELAFGRWTSGVSTRRAKSAVRREFAMIRK